MNLTELIEYQQTLRNMTLAPQTAVQAAHSALATAELDRASVLEQMTQAQLLSVNSAKALAEINPEIYDAGVNLARIYADISPAIEELGANAAKICSDMQPVLAGVYANFVKLYADVQPVGVKLYDEILNARANIQPKLHDYAINSAKFLSEVQSLISELSKSTGLLSDVGKGIAFDYNIFYSAGLFPPSQSLPELKDYKAQNTMADNFDKDIQALVDNLRKQSSEFEQDFKKIFQQVESLSDTIHSELDTIAKPSKIKKPFKRKISVKKAQTLCQKYKTHQLRHLYKNLRSFALVNINYDNVDTKYRQETILAGAITNEPDNLYEFTDAAADFVFDFEKEPEGGFKSSHYQGNWYGSMERIPEDPEGKMGVPFDMPKVEDQEPEGLEWCWEYWERLASLVKTEGQK